MEAVVVIYAFVFLAIVVFAVQQWRSYADFHSHFDAKRLRVH